MALHHLARGDQTAIHYRWDPSLRPALSIEPGDEVIVDTRSGEDDQLPRDGTAADLDGLDFRRLHALSGPIHVAGAEPGDALAIEILDLLPSDWAFTMQRPGAGLLDDFPTYLKTYPIDREQGVVEFAAGIRVPLRPFLGVMGVAPASGERSTVPPGEHGGNLDCRDLKVGATLLLPVQVPGGLFSCGDGHAAQGDGEVCVTAAECALTARLRFTILEHVTFREPRAETPDSFITLSAAPSFEEAARRCLLAMLDLIQERTTLSRADAYALASVCVDLRINQVVNRPMIGVRCVLPRSVIEPVRAP